MESSALDTARKYDINKLDLFQPIEIENSLDHFGAQTSISETC